MLPNWLKYLLVILCLLLPTLANAQGVTPTHEVGTATVNSELPAASTIAADNQAAPSAPSVYSFQMCFDGATWDRCTGSGVDTEMPSAASLADNTANPTVPGVAAFIMCYDGATWDRCLGGLTDTDDGTIAGSQVPNLGVALNYYYDGANWVRDRRDPCQSGNKLYVPISQTTGTQLVTGTASTRTYVCAISVLSATAQNIALVSGTGTVCATSTGAMVGGTTAATGWNFAANSGIVLGTGAATVAKSNTDADNICILMSSSGQLSGVLAYVVAPN